MNQSMNSEKNRKSPENKVDRSTYMKRRVGALALSAVLAFGSYLVIDSAIDQLSFSFSETTKEYVVQPGEGLSNAAAHVDGVSNVNIRDVQYYIEDMPANALTLWDGLQEYETLIIPESVAP